MTCLWLLIVSVLVVAFWRQRKKSLWEETEYEEEANPELIVEEETVELQLKEPIVFFSGTEIEWQKLSTDLYFDEKWGDLHYGEKVHVRLKDNPLRLFRRFLKAERFELAFKDICIDVLGRSVNNEIRRGDKSVVSNVVCSLRNVLTPFPFIRIEPIWGVGYRMIIVELDPSEEKQVISERDMKQTF